MGGIEDRPILAKSKDRTVTDINGKKYLDFQSGQMGAAISHQHPRMVAVIEKTMKTMFHSSNVMLNVPRLINEGALKGPASSYTDEVFGAIWRIFDMEE